MSSKTKDLVQPVEIDDGLRVLPATRRPDGTLRKERKIKPGYTPQDEQPVYKSAQVLARQNVPVCPGMDPSMLEQAQQAKSKAAKKNEKRKEKKAEACGESQASAPSTSSTVAATTQQMSQLSTGPSQPATSAPAPAASAEPEDPKAAAEKALRNLKKKIRQAEALVEKRDSGTALSAEEAEKASKLSSWLSEANALEDKIASL